MNSSVVIANIQEQGFRITIIRKALVEIFSNATTPLSVQTIKENLNQKNIDANVTTIYRELQFFQNNGYITEVHVSPKRICYESSHLEHHHHLVCEKCGAVQDITHCLPATFEKDVLSKTGFSIKKHMLEFYGLCAKCLKKK